MSDESVCHTRILSVSAPLPEYVGVIRCKDCTFWNVHGRGDFGFCTMHKFVAFSDGFCAWADKQTMSKVAENEQA